MSDTTYKITRFMQDAPNEDIATGLTRDEAEAHCQRPDTHGPGWFDGFDVENPTDDELADRQAQDLNLLNAVVAVTALTRGE